MSLPTNFFIGRGKGVEPFGPFTFTNAQTYGRYGPTTTQARSVYDTATYPWLLDNNIFQCTSEGIQTLIIKSAGTYRITVRGAVNTRRWDNSSFFANSVPVLTGEKTLSAGTKLWIGVGQIGAYQNDSRLTYSQSAFSTFWASGVLNTGERRHIMSAGCGGSFVSQGSSLGSSGLIVAAGGGGGMGDEAATNTFSQPNGTTNANGQNGNLGAGGTGGNGGTSNSYASTFGGGGGGGFLSDGQVFTSYGTPGGGWRSSGGLGGANMGAGTGGFGGGGSGSNSDEPGGGGGYSGGGGGGYNGSGGFSSNRYGGGGGSATTCSNTSTSTYTAGTYPEHGYVTLVLL